MLVVAKIGSSSVTDDDGEVVRTAIAKLCAEVATARQAGHRIVIVTSGAIGAGLPALGLGGRNRPRDIAVLQAVAAVGQIRLMQAFNDELGALGMVAGQVLVAPLDFMDRKQYLHARGTLTKLLDLGVVPVVNENDTIADDEVRYGDNDRVAALVAHLLGAELLLLLTDTPGVLTADPRLDSTASLIEEVVEIDHELERVAGGAGSDRGSGGMASKLAAAKIASWSGVRTVIAAAHRRDVLADSIVGAAGVGTSVMPHDRKLSSRRLWIAFAVGSSGTIVVDEGARRALVGSSASLLAAGVTAVDGDFDADSAVEIAGPDGRVFAKGMVRVDATTAAKMVGLSSRDLPDGVTPYLVHRDDLVVLP
jgi:glutamate 5-kinase